MWRTEWDSELRDNYNVPGGLSARQLAKALGTTKGSVVGRARFIGLQQSSGKPRKPNPERRACSEALKFPTAVGTVEPIVPIATPPKPAPATIAHDFKPMQPSSPWHTCQWIEATTDLGNAPRCGAKTIPGRSWCPEHAAIVWAPSRNDAA